MDICLLPICRSRLYNAEKECHKISRSKGRDLCKLQAGRLAIFWPQDGHQPCIGEGDIHKAIFKVKA